MPKPPTPESAPVLLTWIAVRHDPFNPPRKNAPVDTPPSDGPTLTVLFHEKSRYKGKIRDVVFLHRQWNEGSGEEAEAVARTTREIRRRDPSCRVHEEVWTSPDPTDHSEIFKFMKLKVPELRRRFPGRELVIHVSPGTPSMHTVWVLMAETGFIDPPFTLVQSYKDEDRGARATVVPVRLDIETFYKRYRESASSRARQPEDAIPFPPPRSPKLIELMQEARRYARLRVPVLILGERGTGKTTLASWIRMNSAFRKPELDKNWLRVACGQFNRETMRSELFGYRKGAFTGADQDHDGVLTTADGDTVLLDEVGDVSRDLQRLLIKAVEEREYQPIGSTRLVKSDFRLICATNLSLSELRSRLDPDFFDRVGGIQLTVPALRETPEDLDRLWDSALNQAARRADVGSPPPLPDEVHTTLLRRLRSMPLHGNLRDLYLVAYRLIAAVSDPDAPMPGLKAVDYALSSLESAPKSEEGEPSRLGDAPPWPDDVERRVAMAWARGVSIDQAVDLSEKFETRRFFAECKSWMAGQLQEAARRRGCKEDEICDMTDRQLRNWREKDR